MTSNLFDSSELEGRVKATAEYIKMASHWDIKDEAKVLLLRMLGIKVPKEEKEKINTVSQDNENLNIDEIKEVNEVVEAKNE